jgi:polysaccharide biosynthesis protein PslH
MTRSSRMRVLVVATRVPWPLHHGGRLRLHHFLRELSPEANVTLAAVHDPANAEHLPDGVCFETPANGDVAAAPVGWGVRRARRFVGYDAAVGGWLRTYATPARFDVVLLSGTTPGVYAADVQVPIVWDPVDDPVLYVLRDAGGRPWRWPGALKAAGLFGLLGRTVADRAAAVVLSSSVDAVAAQRWSRPTPTVVIPNGVDLDYFRPCRSAGEAGTVVFVGSLSFPPNVDAMVRFARDVWPALRQRGAAKRLLIVGKQPTDAVKSLAGEAGIELAADVPDVRPYLERAAVVIVPTRKGAGVKNKILEACAAQRAVIASPVAAAGLSARGGVDLLIARSRQEWIDAVEAVLTEPERAAALAAAGRVWVESAHRWSESGERLLAVLGNACGGGSHRAGASVRAETTCVAASAEAACR